VIRVLHYVYKMDRGGIETLIMNLYRNIDRNKIQFDFAVHTDEKGHYDKEIKELGGEFIYFPQMRRNPLLYFKTWDTFWRNNNEKYKAFHFHTPTLANIYPLMCASKYKVDIRIVHSHNTFANKGKLQKIHDIVHNYHSQKISKYGNKFYACSKPAAEWLFGHENTKKLGVEIFRNGVNTSNFAFNQEVRKNKRKELNLENKTVIGHIGRFAHAKNHKFIIDVFKTIKKKDANAVLMLIGTGELMDETKKYAKECVVSDSVQFLGIRSDIPELLMAMDLFLFPSFHEGLPVTLIEAQASGIPILASDRIANEVKIFDGFYFESITKDAETWANECIKIINNYNRRDTRIDIKKAGYDILEATEMYKKLILP
jgi:glycosyltransferase involved in cell wall biosynthesis